MQKSTEVMKSMQQLIKVPEVAATMQALSKEMMKVIKPDFPSLQPYRLYLVVLTCFQQIHHWEAPTKMNDVFLDMENFFKQCSNSIFKYHVKPSEMIFLQTNKFLS